MKNNLKFQLDRMHRLMENKNPSNKKIISEQVLSKVFDVIESFGKSTDEILNLIKGAGFKESERVAKSFENLLNKEIKSLSQEEYKFVSAIIRRVVPEVFESFELNLEKIISSKNSVPGFFDKVKTKLINGQMTAQDFVYYMRTMYQKEINVDAVNLYIEKLKNVSDTIESLPENSTHKILLALKNILDNVKAVPADFFKTLWVELKNTKFPSFVINNMKNRLKLSYDQTYDQNLKPLEKEMTDQLERILNKRNIGGNRDYTNEIKIINEKLQQYRTQRVQAAKTHFDEFLELLKKEPKFQEFFDPKSNSYYQKWWSANGETNFLIRLLEGYEKSEKMLPKIEITVSKVEALKKLLAAFVPGSGVSLNTKETYSRLLNVVLFWSPRSATEEIINYNILGFRTWFVKGVAQKIIFSIFVVGFWYSVGRAFIDYILSSVNASRIAKGEKPYDWIDKITQEDMNEIKDLGGVYAIFALWINQWSKSTRFLSGDMGQAFFWSPAAQWTPELFKLVNELRKPKPNMLPVLHTISPDSLQNEVRSVTSDSINVLNGDPKTKQYVVDTLKLSVPTGDQIIEKSDSLISNLIK